MTTNGRVLVLAGLLGGAAPGASFAGTAAGALPAVFLEPVADEVVQGVRPQKCFDELLEAFGKKGWPLAAAPEEAAARAEVRQCLVYARSKVKSKVTETGGEIKGPQPGHKMIPGGAHATGSENEYGADTEEERFVLLVVRLSVEDRFADLSSDARDERLGQAAHSVVKAAKAWLAGPKPR
jgi:hypothetical protein